MLCTKRVLFYHLKQIYRLQIHLKLKTTFQVSHYLYVLLYYLAMASPTVEAAAAVAVVAVVAVVALVAVVTSVAVVAGEAVVAAVAAVDSTLSFSPIPLP